MTPRLTDEQVAALVEEVQQLRRRVAELEVDLDTPMGDGVTVRQLAEFIRDRPRPSVNIVWPPKGELT
jgi:hypothetical protein